MRKGFAGFRKEIPTALHFMKLEILVQDENGGNPKSHGG